MIDLQIIQDNLPAFLDGARVTILLLLASAAAGLSLSLPLAVARVSANPFLSRPVFLFTYVLRGTPLLVQLFMVYFGLAQFDMVRESSLWPLLREPWFCAWIAFTLNTAAYTTEMLAGALRATPAGEVEAARSLGMTGFDIYTRILIPGAVRRALPQYGNELVMLMHATSIASAVTLVEITRVARDVHANTLLAVEAFGTAALFYLALTLCITGLFRLLERRLLRHLARPAGAS